LPFRTTAVESTTGILSITDRLNCIEGKIFSLFETFQALLARDDFRRLEFQSGPVGDIAVAKVASAVATAVAEIHDHN